MDDLEGTGEGHHAGDACFCCHESEEDGDLALEVRSPSKASWLFAGDFGQHHKTNSHVPPETWEFVFSLRDPRGPHLLVQEDRHVAHRETDFALSRAGVPQRVLHRSDGRRPARKMERRLLLPGGLLLRVPYGAGGLAVPLPRAEAAR